MDKDYYKILIISASGRGKTYSFRNMDPETTGFINAENKPLPFKNNFKHHKRCITLNSVREALKEYANDDSIKVIVLDSLSAYIDMLLSHSRANKKGYEVWNFYNEKIGSLLNFIKTINKEVFITAHYEWLSDEGGTRERRLKVKGKEWEGIIEKEFTMVLYADVKFEDKKPKYYFSTVLENSSAKCPPMIFGEDVYQIENDSKMVLDKILEFTT